MFLLLAGSVSGWIRTNGIAVCITRYWRLCQPSLAGHQTSRCTSRHQPLSCKMQAHESLAAVLAELSGTIRGSVDMASANNGLQQQWRQRPRRKHEGFECQPHRGRRWPDIRSALRPDGHLRSGCWVWTVSRLPVRTLRTLRTLRPCGLRWSVLVQKAR